MSLIALRIFQAYLLSVETLGSLVAPSLGLGRYSPSLRVYVTVSVSLQMIDLEYFAITRSTHTKAQFSLLVSLNFPMG